MILELEESDQRPASLAGSLEAKEGDASVTPVA